jgi:hypothetical protein
LAGGEDSLSERIRTNLRQPGVRRQRRTCLPRYARRPW